MPWNDGLTGPHLEIAAYQGSPLRVIAGRYEDLRSSTTTIYHFGHDAGEGRFRGFALRSKTGYAVEES
jgi:hypothetical protein